MKKFQDEGIVAIHTKTMTRTHRTSIMDVWLKLPNKKDLVSKDNIQIMTLPAALVLCDPGYYSNNPIEARAALSILISMEMAE